MSVEINFVGDVALFKKYEELNIDPFKEIVLPKSDYNIGNFEFIIPNNRKKKFYDTNEKYSTSFEYFRDLKLEKFNAFGFANNHVLDYAEEGVRDTIDILHKKRINTFGFGSKKINSFLFEINSIKFNIIAFVKKGRWSKSNNKNVGPDEYIVEDILQEIKINKSIVDHVIIFPHWGTELIDIPENKDVKNARLFIDNGASVVVGHHPHIIQGCEQYKDGFIAYSLGSFIYIQEEELGYTKEPTNRYLSICLNVKFYKKKIINVNPHYYKYDRKTKIPMPILNSNFDQYISFVNNNIENKTLYNKKIKIILVKRELYAFLSRFKKSPVRTLLHYITYIKLKHLRKILNI